MHGRYRRGGGGVGEGLGRREGIVERGIGLKMNQINGKVGHKNKCLTSGQIKNEHTRKMDCDPQKTPNVYKSCGRA